MNNGCAAPTLELCSRFNVLLLLSRNSEYCFEPGDLHFYFAVGPADYVALLVRIIQNQDQEPLRSRVSGNCSLFGGEEEATGLTPCGGFQYCVWA